MSRINQIKPRDRRSVRLKNREPGITAGAGARALALFILIGTPGTILWYAWWGRFYYHNRMAQAAAYAALVFLLFLNQRFFRRDLKSQGLRIDNLVQSLKLVAPVTLILAAAILFYGAWLQQWSFGQWPKIGLYLIWGTVQQYALQNMLLARGRTLSGRPAPAIVAAALIFALVHIPEPELVLFSFAGALAYCWVFSRVPNIYTLALSHSLLAVLLLVSTGHDYSIGRSGYRFGAYGGGVLVAGGYLGTGKPFIATVPGYEPGVPSLVKLFLPDGTFIRQWEAFPEYGFSANLAVGDLGSGSGDSIVTAPGPAPGHPAEIRVFDTEGVLRHGFRVPGIGNYGAYVAVGCGKIYVTPGPAPAQPPSILEFDAVGNLLRSWRPEVPELVSSIRAFPLAPASGGREKGCPEKLVLFGTPISVNPSTAFLMDPDDESIRPLASSEPTFGLNAAPFRRFPEVDAIITAPGPLRGYGPHVRIYDIHGKEIYSRVLYEGPSVCGSNVSAVDLDGDGDDELVLGEGVCRGVPPRVRIENFSGKLLYLWDAYP